MTATFASRLDAECRLRGWDNCDAAAQIRRRLARAGLGRTTRVTVSLWRRGRREPHLATQRTILAWLAHWPVAPASPPPGPHPVTA